MKATLAQITSDALALSSQDRAALTRTLIESLDTEPEEDLAAVDEAWRKEIEQRIEDLRSGRVKAIPAEEVFARLRNKYG